MNHCHNCGLSIGETVTFCATCGAPVSVAVAGTAPRVGDAAIGAGVRDAIIGARVRDAASASRSSAVRVRPRLPACGCAGASCPPSTPPACARRAAPRSPSSWPPSRGSRAPSPSPRATRRPGASASPWSTRSTRRSPTTARARRAVPWTVGKRPTPPPPRPGRQTRSATSPAGCRCLVFFEHESLSVDEEREFVDYAAGRGLRVTAAAVAAFHEEKRSRLESQVDQRLDEASGLLREARTLEKSDPREAVALYRKAVESPSGLRRVAARRASGHDTTCRSPSIGSPWCSRAWGGRGGARRDRSRGLAGDFSSATTADASPTAKRCASAAGACTNAAGRPSPVSPVPADRRGAPSSRRCRAEAPPGTRYHKGMLPWR